MLQSLQVELAQENLPKEVGGGQGREPEQVVICF